MTDIDELLSTIEAPTTDVRADVRRGELALRRRHRWQVGAAAAGVAAVGVAGFVVQGGATGTPGSSGSFSGQPGTSQTPQGHPAAAPRSCAAHGCGAGHHDRVGKPPLTARRAQRQLERQMNSDASQATLQTYHDVLAQHLDPGGGQLRLAQNEQGGGGMFGTKLDWRGGGMLEITVGRTWASSWSFANLEPAHLVPTTFRGHEARVSTAGDDLVVVVRHDDGLVVTLVASTSFGNNGTSTASLGLTQEQLLEAAADPRLTLPPGV